MAKQVIVLSRQNGDTTLVQGLAWIVVPASFQAVVANPLTISQFAFATSAEIAALRLGQVVEVPFQVAFPKTSTVPQIKTEFLRTASLAVVQYLSSQVVALQFYGTFWDGTTWSS